MKRALALLAVLPMLFALAGCDYKNEGYQDGVYSAEYIDFDSYGYKDFLRVTVQDGSIQEILFDGIDADDGLKSEDDKYQANMESVMENYPKKYTADLINQYMEKLDIEKVDMVAGATYSSDSFKALFLALEKSMKEGNTDLVVIENIPVK